VEQAETAEQEDTAEPTEQDAPETPETEHAEAQDVQGVTEEQTVLTQEEDTMDQSYTAQQAAPVAPERIISDEVSTITEGTVIKGDIVSTGSLDIKGQVNGNVSCNGKLTVTGVVNGNSSTSEFFADQAQVEGEVISTGTVKIGLGSVVIGNVTSTSAVIAGAIKGDIDVQGPVVVDTSAVVMGNIKSRSVQINNGAVIEGFCSQCYSDIDMDSLFESKKGLTR
jgi:cytoskeletal protein CcmA (bactofilin family)